MNFLHVVAVWFNDGGDLDSSPGSRMYPVMMHQSAGSFSAPVFPDFADSNAACTMATNMFDNPMAGTSQDIDPSGEFILCGALQVTQPQM